MPTYEYKCDACGHQFEELQKMSDPPVKKCPECGESVRRLITTFAGQLKSEIGLIPECKDEASCPSSMRRRCDRRTCELLDH
jgi:putative FmdB family regulatory protein